MDVCEKRIISDLIKGADISSPILELGVGTGRHTIGLVNKGFKTVGIEVGRTLLKIAHSKINLKENVELVLAEVENLPFKPQTFMIILSVQTFDYIHDINKALQEAKNVLKDDGRFIITLLNGISLYSTITRKIGKWSDYGVLRLLSPNEIRRVFVKNGFKIARMKFYQTLPIEDAHSIRFPKFIRSILSIVDYILGEIPPVKYVGKSIFIDASK